MGMGLGMNVGINPAQSVNSHVTQTINPNLNIVHRLSMLIKSQLPHLQAISMNIKVSKK